MSFKVKWIDGKREPNKVSRSSVPLHLSPCPWDINRDAGRQVSIAGLQPAKLCAAFGKLALKINHTPAKVRQHHAKHFRVR